MQVGFTARAEIDAARRGEDLRGDLLEVLHRDPLRANGLVVLAEGAGEITGLGQHHVDHDRPGTRDRRAQARLDAAQELMEPLSRGGSLHEWLSPQRAGSSSDVGGKVSLYPGNDNHAKALPNREKACLVLQSFDGPGAACEWPLACIPDQL